jgi:alpha-tubulin suppressor-like RCC1 family protein
MRTAAVKSDGSLWRWGGSGASYTWGLSDSSDPVQSGCDYDWSAVFSGGSGTQYGLKKDGRLFAWGQRSAIYGPNDPEGWMMVNEPVQVGTDSDWKFLSSGQQSTVAIKTNGTMYQWGDNVPTGTVEGVVSFENDWTPRQIGTTNDWASVSVSEQLPYQVAVKTDGTLWAWGEFSVEIEGVKVALFNSHAPVQLAPGNDWKMAAVGGSDNIIIALKGDGTLWALGRNASGALGLGEEDYGYVASEMTQIGVAQDWRSVSVSQTRVLAVKLNGQLWGWGDNSNGALGLSLDVSTLDAPTRVGTGSSWRTPVAGVDVSFVLDGNGQIYGMGPNYYDVLNIDGMDWQAVFQPTKMLIPTEPGDWCSVGFYKNHFSKSRFDNY